MRLASFIFALFMVFSLSGCAAATLDSLALPVLLETTEPELPIVDDTDADAPPSPTVASEEAKEAQTASPSFMVSLKTNLNLRNKPSTESEVVGTGQQGTAIEAIGVYTALDGTRWYFGEAFDTYRNITMVFFSANPTLTSTETSQEEMQALNEHGQPINADGAVILGTGGATGSGTVGGVVENLEEITDAEKVDSQEEEARGLTEVIFINTSDYEIVFNTPEAEAQLKEYVIELARATVAITNRKKLEDVHPELVGEKIPQGHVLFFNGGTGNYDHTAIEMNLRRISFGESLTFELTRFEHPTHGFGQTSILRIRPIIEDYVLTGFQYHIDPETFRNARPDGTFRRIRFIASFADIFNYIVVRGEIPKDGDLVMHPLLENVFDKFTQDGTQMPASMILR